MLFKKKLLLSTVSQLGEMIITMKLIIVLPRVGWHLVFVCIFKFIILLKVDRLLDLHEDLKYIAIIVIKRGYKYTIIFT